MSAYGVILRSSASAQLEPTAWKVKPRDGNKETRYVFIFHLTLSSAPPDLVGYMHEQFADELERGNSYPQEPEAGTRLSRDAFEAYFFAADVLVGIQLSREDLVRLSVNIHAANEEYGPILSSNATLQEVRNKSDWKDCVAGFYYVKPNYPGRSSHICNGGFIVPLHFRGQGFARPLARSYLHYAPRLGYEASVFNLVYVNNIASVRLWEALGFSKAGRIPRAGRLKRKDGKGEEFVDAWIIYKSFIPETLQLPPNPSESTK